MKYILMIAALMMSGCASLHQMKILEARIDRHDSFNRSQRLELYTDLSKDIQHLSDRLIGWREPSEFQTIMRERVDKTRKEVQTLLNKLSRQLNNIEREE